MVSSACWQGLSQGPRDASGRRVGPDDDEGDSVEAEAVAEQTCTVQACDSFCNLGGDCGYDAVDAANCVSDCLDACDDGFADDGDARVMSCLEQNLGDVWCENGLLESCCAELDGWSDLC